MMNIASGYVRSMTCKAANLASTAFERASDGFRRNAQSIENSNAWQRFETFRYDPPGGYRWRDIFVGSIVIAGLLWLAIWMIRRDERHDVLRSFAAEQRAIVAKLEAEHEQEKLELIAALEAMRTKAASLESVHNATNAAALAAIDQIRASGTDCKLSSEGLRRVNLMIEEANK